MQLDACSTTLSLPLSSSSFPATPPSPQGHPESGGNWATSRDWGGGLCWTGSDNCNIQVLALARQGEGVQTERLGTHSHLTDPNRTDVCFNTIFLNLSLSLLKIFLYLFRFFNWGISSKKGTNLNHILKVNLIYTHSPDQDTEHFQNLPRAAP